MNYLLAVVLALAVAQSAWAATDTTWNGGSGGTEASPINFYDSTKWSSGKTPSNSYNLKFSVDAPTVLTNTASASTYVADHICFNKGQYTVLGPAKFNGFQEGASESGTVSITKKGDWTTHWYFYPCYTSGSTVVVTNKTGNWTLGGSGKDTVMCAPYTASSTFRFVVESGTVTFKRTSAIGYKGTGYLEINGGSVAFDSGCDFEIGKYGAGNVIMNGGSFSITSDKWVYMGRESGSSGNITLNGGTFTAKHIHKGGNGGTITFDGGTLKANASCGDNGGIIQNDTGIKVVVAANGGTIDTGGYNVTYGKNTTTKSGVANDGGLKFQGGGSVTVTGDANNPRLTYNGRTTVAVGTTLKVPTATIGGGFAATIPSGLADGVYTVVLITGDGAFASDVLEDAVLPSDPKASFFLSGDGKAIMCAYGGLVWIGASGNFSEPSNWLGGRVPVAGETDSIFIQDTGAHIYVTNDIVGLTPRTINLKGDMDIRLRGEKFTGVEKVVNSTIVSTSYRDHIIAPVEFKGAVTIGGNMWIQFGDAKGTTLAFDPEATSYAQKGLRGNITLTGNWTPDRALTIGDGILTVQGTLSGSHQLTVNSGGTLKADVVSYSSTALLAGNAGTVEFGVVTASGSGDYKFYNGGASNGVVAVGRFVNNAANTVRLNSAEKLVMGEGGFTFGPNTAADQGTWKSFSVGLNTTANIWPSADFTFATNSYATTGDPKSPGNTRRDFMQGFNTINNVVYGSKLNVYTTDYYDGTVARTVTVDGCFYCAKASNEFNVRGIGTVVVNSYWSNYPGKVGVYDTATLQINPGCRVGTGTLTVDSGAALQVGDSGTVSLGGSLTLNSGAKLKFNFTENRTAPKLNVSNKTVTATGTYKVAVSAAEGVRPVGGDYVLTSGGKFGSATVSLDDDAPFWAAGVSKNADNDIVLSVKPVGLMFFVQ